MNGTGIDFSCIDDLQKKLEVMGRKGSKLENEALLAGAEIINKEIVNRAPEKTGKAKNI